MRKSESVLKEKTKKQEATTTVGLIKFFIIFFLTSMLICVILAAMSGGESWKLQLFHSNGYSDMFMDFFNSMRDAGDENVYTARNNIYPPLCLLLFKFFGAFVSEELIDLPNTKRITLQYDQNCMIVYFIFAIMCILLMTSFINKYVNDINKDNNKKTVSSHTLISFMLVISYPVMYCIERGNIIILSVIMTMFFIFFRDSESKIVKELSYIALAFAAGIKLYPAIFGILLLIEKKYKDAIRLIIYGVIFVIFPFVFFMDLDSSALSISSQSVAAAISSSHTSAIAVENSSPIASILENLISFATKKKNSLNFSSVSIQNFVFLFERDNTTLAQIVGIITEFIAVAALLFAKKTWQKVFLVTYLMLNIPSASSSYSLAFLIIPFIMFLYDDKGNGYLSTNRPKTDWAYIISFALLFTPIPMFWYYYQNQAQEIFSSIGVPYQTRVNQLIGVFVFQFMFIFMVVEIFGKLAKNKIKTEKVSNTSSVTEETAPVSENSDQIIINSANSENENNSDNEELQ
ncbi:MAG: DUF2029 domain-containing protein [Clostridia bacterium]|nr:DUF2029 domain-containing protein [Clostridia bacterium]